MIKTPREIQFEKDIEQASQRIAQVSTWLKREGLQAVTITITHDEYEWIIKSLETALATLDYDPAWYGTFTYRE